MKRKGAVAEVSAEGGALAGAGVPVGAGVRAGEGVRVGAGGLAGEDARVGAGARASSADGHVIAGAGRCADASGAGNRLCPTGHAAETMKFVQGPEMSGPFP